MDPIMPLLVSAALVILVLGMILRKAAQPALIGYLLGGVALGPSMIGLFTDTTTIQRLGEFGVLLLLFFVGMEISLPQLIARWKVSVVGALTHIFFATGIMFLFGALFDWPHGRSLLFGFIVSLSSTSVVLKVLQDRNELECDMGRDVTGILLVQDLAVVPMMIIIGLFSGTEMKSLDLAKQCLGAGLFLFLFLFLARSNKPIRLPFSSHIRKDQEMEVFAAFILCFGFALVSGLLHLSTALGAFMAGIYASAARETTWIHHKLEPFRVVFLALFFLAVGMLVDVAFLRDHWLPVLSLVLFVFIGNTLLQAIVLRFLGQPWRSALYTSAILAQMGEFGFLLAAVGHNQGLLSSMGYQMILMVTVITLVLSPLWFTLARKLFLKRS